jgi:hypothetical protein
VELDAHTSNSTRRRHRSLGIDHPLYCFHLKRSLTVLLPMRSAIDVVLMVAAVLAILYEFIRR